MVEIKLQRHLAESPSTRQEGMLLSAMLPWASGSSIQHIRFLFYLEASTANIVPSRHPLINVPYKRLLSSYLRAALAPERGVKNIYVRILSSTEILIVSYN